jgi:hypothetical protein
MFKCLIHILGLVVAGLFIGNNAYSQLPVTPTNNYSNLQDGVNTSMGRESNHDLYTSIHGNFLTTIFHLTVNTNTNNIFNQKPVFDTFPTDITIAFDSRLSFLSPNNVRFINELI